jgi:hypothetical protein
VRDAADPAALFISVAWNVCLEKERFACLAVPVDNLARALFLCSYARANFTASSRVAGWRSATLVHRAALRPAMKS